MTTKVELLPAHMWICDACGRDNFVRCRQVDPESDEGRELAEDAGRFMEGDFLTAPDRVACDFCHAEFDVEMGE